MATTNYTPEEVARVLDRVRDLAAEAGHLVAKGLQHCDELASAGGDAVGEIRGHLAAAGRALGNAEVRSYPVRQGRGQLVMSRGVPQQPHGWAQWEVRDEAGALVGFVAEERDFADGAGPASYLAVHNPTGEGWGALWRSEGHTTPWLAMAALAEHLEENPEENPEAPRT